MIAELLAWDFRNDVQDYLAWAICVAALIWGGGPERAVAITWLLFFKLVPGAYDVFGSTWDFQGGVNFFIASIDILAAASWVMIALYANRIYTLWIAGLQVLAVIAHLASAIAEPISSPAYAVMAITPSWMQLLLLAIGLVGHLVRKRQFGAYRDWRINKFNDNNAALSNYGTQIAALLSKDQKSWRDSLK